MRPLFRTRRAMGFEQEQHGVVPTQQLVSPKRQYKLNRRQKNRMKRQTPSYNPNANSLASRVVARLPFRF